MAMLEVNNLSIQFGGLRAVDGFNMTDRGNHQTGRPGHHRKKHHRDQQGRNRENLPEYPSFQGYAGS